MTETVLSWMHILIGLIAVFIVIGIGLKSIRLSKIQLVCFWLIGLFLMVIVNSTTTLLLFDPVLAWCDINRQSPWSLVTFAVIWTTVSLFCFIAVIKVKIILGAYYSTAYGVCLTFSLVSVLASLLIYVYFIL